MQRRLIDANREQADPPLAEVEKILETLEEAWSQVSPAEPPQAPHSYRAESAEPALDPMAAEEHVPVSCAY